ncbi:ATP-dependent protease ATPase subunit HslU [Thermosediminibacter oceani]|uniref:ATP-dependent protease ATPase subunit HslU n=1 Tax=Thermosediminibacter oceani (strain ATCC BAA-1034 / DSM 16646 / JW/IW-1228P) TaxID=555079 RepID=D9S373_THEOJ|nr:ATP-dependent protease ATPase subunit HslU [Thermosediminibacter oceani]ADL07850.1 heat shock protein HslVU, ATPase subunit HslU [Thermosediminibacter oceani DSM 16646]
MEDLTPRKIVEELDKYIVGQEEAKKCVAIALRNRYRRQKLSKELQEEIMPKNILMIGPTGVGKTEIARRLAKLVNAPFVKVEATKFTEVGYVGRDVDSMVRDLVETSIRMVKMEKIEQVKDRARELADLRIAEILQPDPVKTTNFRNPLEALFGNLSKVDFDEKDEEYESRIKIAREKRKALLEDIKSGKLDNEMIEIEVEDNSPPVLEVFSNSGIEEMGINFQDLFGGILPKRRKKKKLTIATARKIMTQEEAQKLIDMDEVVTEAIKRAEETGIIFIDEIDKIAGREQSTGPDVSREGVQRDILPIVEGCTVVTKYGPVKTDHILFIAAGAFHVSKPSDLIPELQGRFPIRVELKSLSKEDLKRILVEPKNSLIKQYKALLETEGIKIHFTEDAIDEIVSSAVYVNQQNENIGARRLHTIMEKLLEDISFNASEIRAEVSEVVIDRSYVSEKLRDIVKDKDLSMYIL